MPSARVEELVYALGQRLDCQWAEEESARALVRIGDPAAVEPLIERLDWGRLSDAQESFTAAVVEALGSWGMPRPLFLLVRPHQEGPESHGTALVPHRACAAGM